MEERGKLFNTLMKVKPLLRWNHNDNESESSKNNRKVASRHISSANLKISGPRKEKELRTTAPSTSPNKRATVSLASSEPTARGDRSSIDSPRNSSLNDIPVSASPEPSNNFAFFMKQQKSQDSSSVSSPSSTNSTISQIISNSKQRRGSGRHQTVEVSSLVSKLKIDSVETDLLTEKLQRLSQNDDLQIGGNWDVDSALFEFGLPQKSKSIISNVLKSYSVEADMNKSGWQKSKADTAYSANGTKPKCQMEDVNVCLVPFNDDFNMAFFAVFDGHVDKNAALEAKNLVPQEFISFLKEMKKPFDNCKDIFEKTFASVDKKLKNFEYEGCTATVVFMWRHEGYVYLQAANVGDSSAFMWDDGKIIPLTKDHKATDPEEQERVKQLGVQLYEGATRIGGLAVSRSLGDHFLKETSGIISVPYISDVYKFNADELELGQNVQIVIASDGLWDVISGKQALTIIKDEPGAEESAKKLIKTALSSPKCKDNTTIIVVQL